ncbi:hypothetical protein GEMRC1_012975 [Eukaryota sp. GEM-RC1]
MQRLVWLNRGSNAKQLEGEHNLQYYGIQEESVLHLVLPLRSEQGIAVVTEEGRQIGVDYGSIAYIKDQICKKEGVSASRLRINGRNGVVLQDHVLVYHYGYRPKEDEVCYDRDFGDQLYLEVLEPAVGDDCPLDRFLNFKRKSKKGGKGGKIKRSRT